MVRNSLMLGHQIIDFTMSSKEREASEQTNDSWASESVNEWISFEWKESEYDSVVRVNEPMHCGSDKLLRSFVCSLVHFTHSQPRGKLRNTMSQNHTVLNHNAMDDRANGPVRTPFHLLLSTLHCLKRSDNDGLGESRSTASHRDSQSARIIFPSTKKYYRCPFHSDQREIYCVKICAKFWSERM